MEAEARIRAAVSGQVDPEDRLSVVAADLTSDRGWDEAMAGCEHVLHVASPMGSGGNPANPDELIVPARDGALRVLASAACAGVRRVVMTSSCAAATPPRGTAGGVFDEDVWTDADAPGLDTYRRSKAIAERAAWAYVTERHDPAMLTTVLPGAVFGPILSPAGLGSVRVIGRMLHGMPGVPRIGLNVVDVRDLADLHVRAMTAPEAAGERFIAVSEFLWMAEVAAELRGTLGAAARKVPRRTLPDLALRAMSRLDPALRAVVPMLGRRYVHSSEKARTELGWDPRPAATTVVDCARSLLAHGAA